MIVFIDPCRSRNALRELEVALSHDRDVEGIERFVRRHADNLLDALRHSVCHIYCVDDILCWGFRDTTLSPN